MLSSDTHCTVECRRCTEEASASERMEIGPGPSTRVRKQVVCNYLGGRGTGHHLAFPLDYVGSLRPRVFDGTPICSFQSIIPSNAANFTEV